VADIFTVSDMVAKTSGRVDLQDIYTLIDSAGTDKNIKIYVDQIKAKYIASQLSKLPQLIEQMLANNEDNILDRIKKRLDQISVNEDLDIKNLNHLISEHPSIIDERAQRKDGLLGISTGFIDLDDLTFGLQGGQLIVLAARPGMGKTTLAANIAEHHVYNDNGCVAFFSLEMSDKEIFERILSSQSKICSSDLKKGSIHPNSVQHYTETLGRMWKKDFYVMHAEDIMDITNKCRYLKSKHNLSFVVVDYVQLMLKGKPEFAHLMIGEITRNLKRLAGQLNVPILLLSQMNRAIETRQDKKPLLADLKQSGSIEQDADIVMFISRDELIQDQAILSIAKHRSGEVKDLILKFEPKIHRFINSEYTFQAFEQKINEIKNPAKEDRFEKYRNGKGVDHKSNKLMPLGVIKNA